MTIADIPTGSGVYVSEGRPDGRCANGHLMTASNLVVKEGGRVRCRACRQAANRRASARKRLRLSAGIAAPTRVPVDRGDELLAETIDAVRHRPRTVRWGTRAACADVDPDLFLEATQAESESVGGIPTRLPRVREAMAICRRCPVRSECDATALSSTDVPPSGVVASRYWGSRSGRDQVRRAQAAAVIVAAEDES